MDSTYVLRGVYANEFKDVEQCVMQSQKTEEMLQEGKYLTV